MRRELADRRAAAAMPPVPFQPAAPALTPAAPSVAPATLRAMGINPDWPPEVQTAFAVQLHLRQQAPVPPERLNVIAHLDRETQQGRTASSILAPTGWEPEPDDEPLPQSIASELEVNNEYRASRGLAPLPRLTPAWTDTGLDPALRWATKPASTPADSTTQAPLPSLPPLGSR